MAPMASRGHSVAETIPRVRIVEPGFRTLIRRGCNRLGFVFTPEGDRRPSAEEADAAAFTRIRTGLYTDHVYHAVRAGDGLVAFFDPVGSMKTAMGIAQELAVGMEEAGFSGTISAAVGKLARGWGHSVPTLIAVLSASEAAVDETWTRVWQRPKKESPTLWAVGTEAYRRLVEGVMGWALAHYKSSLRAGAYQSFADCAPDQVAGIVERSCADVGHAEVVLQTELSELQIRFTSEGYVQVDIVLDPGKLNDAFREHHRLLAQLAPLLDYAFITRASSGLNSLDTILVGHPRYAPGKIATIPLEDHAALKRSILDICGVQLLGPEHEDLQPPEAWKTWNLPNGRRVVMLKEIKGWFADGGPPMEELHALRAQNRGHFLIEFPS